MKLDAPHLVFFDGLLWYLEVRNWAFTKIKTCPRGSHPFDIRMHHALYFVNTLSSLDHICDYLDCNPSARRVFLDQIKHGFGDTPNYNYLRELRNAIIHRGFDPTASGHANDTTLYVLCPTDVQDRQGKNRYSSTFIYTVDLAIHCSNNCNAAIENILDYLGLFEPAQHIVSKDGAIAWSNDSNAMPDWAKELSRRAFDEMDFMSFATELAVARVTQMRSLLRQPDAAS